MLKKDISPKKAFQTVGILAVACIILGLLFKVTLLFYLALILFFIGVFLKGISLRIARLWLGFAGIIGAVNSRIILSLVFFLILTPIALLYRAFKGGGLKIKRSACEKTCWNDRNHAYKPGDFEKVY